MPNPFFDHPILNSPYDIPARHWELDSSGQPTQRIVESRRPAQFITPIPKPKKLKDGYQQHEIGVSEASDLASGRQRYETISIINAVRDEVAQWRSEPTSAWRVTPETARLLVHWRTHRFAGVRPFFCQIEAVETAIWLTEVAPHSKTGKSFLDHLARANRDANPELSRVALKLATGAGKTTVMAMLIAWQTVNAVRRPGSRHFTRGFLVCTPGLTIRDRLRVLQPNDPDSYYQARELVPADMLDDVRRAKIVITNYHSFKRRERLDLSAGGRALLQGRDGPPLDTLESEGQMLQRIMPDLMGMKNVLAINDEAHHCYREKPPEPNDEDLKGEERKEAERNNEAARLWISGLEAVNRKLGLSRVVDLSATPFFLRGSRYAEGTLFPWTLSDFSLMDAIECGIVKLPRVPVAENIPGNELPMYRNLWEHVRKDMPKKGRGQGGSLDPQKLPARLCSALEALYGHYEKTYRLWQENGVHVPPCFIIVCQNTAISKLLYDYVAGFTRSDDDGTTSFVPGQLPLFRNFDPDTGNPFPRPHTLLIDSEQLEAGDALDEGFREMAADEIERFRRDLVERTGDARAGEKLSDQELLREFFRADRPSPSLAALHPRPSCRFSPTARDPQALAAIPVRPPAPPRSPFDTSRAFRRPPRPPFRSAPEPNRSRTLRAERRARKRLTAERARWAQGLGIDSQRHFRIAGAVAQQAPEANDQARAVVHRASTGARAAATCNASRRSASLCGSPGISASAADATSAASARRSAC